MQSAVDAAIAAGSVVVAATGNEGAIGLSAPANCTGVIAVTAHTINGENADYANIGAAVAVGPQPTDQRARRRLADPCLGAGGPTDNPNWFGYYIWSTILFGNTSPTSGDGPKAPRSGPAYAGFTGTSAATPQVAAVAALIKSMIPGATPAQIRTFIVNTVRPHPAGGACAASGLDSRASADPACWMPTLAVRAAALVAPPVILGATTEHISIRGPDSHVLGRCNGCAALVPMAPQWRSDRRCRTSVVHDTGAHHCRRQRCDLLGGHY